MPEKPYKVHLYGPDEPGATDTFKNLDDAREYLYRPTVELLAHLGVREARELPEHEKLAQEIAAFEKTKEEAPLESK